MRIHIVYADSSVLFVNINDVGELDQLIVFLFIQMQSISGDSACDSVCGVVSIGYLDSSEVPIGSRCGSVSPYCKHIVNGNVKRRVLKAVIALHIRAIVLDELDTHILQATIV